MTTNRTFVEFLIVARDSGFIGCRVYQVEGFQEPQWDHSGFETRATVDEAANDVVSTSREDGAPQVHINIANQVSPAVVLAACADQAPHWWGTTPRITNLVTDAESAVVDRLTRPVDPEWYTSVYGCLEAYRGKAITAEQALTRISELLEPSREAIKRLGRLGNDMHNTQTPQPSGQAKAWAAELQDAAGPIRQIVGFPR